MNIKKIASIFCMVCCLLFAGSIARVEAVTLTLGEKMVQPGAVNVSIPLNIVSQTGQDAVGVSLYVSYDNTKLTYKAVTAGPAAIDAGKGVSGSAPNGVINVVVVGFNQDVIENGVLANIKFDVKSDAVSGTVPLSITDPKVADSDADPLPVTGVNGSIIIDGTPPQGEILIDSGASCTGTPLVSLRIAASDGQSGMGPGAQMRFSNSSSVWPDPPEAYQPATAKSWTLTPGAGYKTVYVKFKDAMGNWSDAYPDSIYLADQVAAPGESIQTAIDNISDGGSVYLKSGLYDQDSVIIIEKDINLIGEGAGSVTVKANIIIKERQNVNISGLSVVYPAGNLAAFTNEYYQELPLCADAGITAINSAVHVNDCVIVPEESVWGNGIQILNLYGSEDIEPLIENNVISGAETAVYYYSQVLGGAASGIIRGNTIDDNIHGITLRMHKECPAIDDNTISNSSQDGIHIAYEDGELLTQRLSRITSANVFMDNNRNIYCDATGTELFP